MDRSSAPGCLPADGVAYRDAIAGAELVATQGLGHRRILREPSVLQQVAAFISTA